MRTLLIDNHDSFTFNLAQLIGEVVGTEPLVVANDAAAWERLPLDEFDAVVLSPGPGRPERSADVGLTADAVRLGRLPILGVCLGHQTIAHVSGGRIRHAPVPVHGGVDAIHHRATGLFDGLPSPLRAVRYHSLEVTDLPDELEPLAWSRDGVLMALRHRERPLWGVQFHPESICSDHGHRLIGNFRTLVGQWWATREHRRHQLPHPPAETPRRPPSAPDISYRVHARIVGRGVDAAAAFDALFAASPVSFWLDSASAATGHGRWSWIGDASGPHAEVVDYDLDAPEVRVTAGSRTVTHPTDVLSYLDAELHRRHLEVDATVPSPLVGGYIGYLGYEVKRDTGATTHHRASTPDAGFVFADRLLAVDHRRDVVWAIALSRPGTRSSAQRWIDGVADRLRDREAASTPGGRVEPARDPAPADLPVRWRHGPDRYRELILACLRDIVDGESYELCLTDTATVDVEVDAVRAYHELRRVNPAPHGALLRLPALSVLSSSPERFLHIAVDGTVEARPIKGTRGRAADPACDAALADDLAMSDKDRAENLMIVDLMRNDIGSVCELGSVQVPGLFEVESYATVHQLVSTVRGKLRPEVSPVACVRAAFPGGSMTGAPKRRSMAILDRLEGGPRGVYAGVLGFFSLSGEVDLSIVIRTLVVEPGRVTFGAGGAIVAGSDPDEEIEEVATKARPLLVALERAVGRSSVGSSQPTAPFVSGDALP